MQHSSFDVSNEFNYVSRQPARCLLPKTLLKYLVHLQVLLITLILGTAATTVLADQHHPGNSPRLSSSHISSFRSSSRGNDKQYGHQGNRSESRFNRNDNRGFRRNDYDNNRFRNFGSSYRYRPARRDNWSVSLNVGSGYYSNFNRFNNFNTFNTFNSFSNHSNYSSIYYGSSVLRQPYGYGPYRNRTTVIYQQPKVVYVNKNPYVSGHVTERVVRPAERSLLRDIHGDCYERTYDSQGRETRIQLPDSACQF